MSFAGVQLRTLRPQAVQRRYFWKTASAQREQLAGTVHSHNSLILLNTRIPPPSFPSKVSSKLQRSLQLHASRWGGIVNLAWVPGTPVNDPNSTEPEWENPSEESYSAIAFSTENGTLEIPEVSTRNLEDVVVQLREHAAASSTAGPNSIEKANANSDSDVVHIYVCTHGQRDCRCGETGGAVYDALRDEVARRSLQDVVKVGGVGHVGGHKYAANVLVYPYGDWLGYVTPADVPDVLDNILSLRKSPFSATTTPPLCPPFWRGRMGLDKEQQLQLFHATPVSNEVESVDLKPHSRS